MILSLFRRAALCAAFALTAPAALAQDASPSANFIALGAGMAPDYLGSNDYRAIPFVAGQLDTPVARFSIRGLGVRSDFLTPLTEGRFSGGIDLSYGFGRDDVADARVSRLPDIDGAVEAGIFAGYTLRGTIIPPDSLTLSVAARTDVNGAHGGVVVEPSVSYGTFLSRRIRADLSLQASYGSAGFAQTYFGISPAAARASGLAAYRAGDGIHAVSGSLGLSYAVTERWGISGRVGYSRLTGSAASSPVVRTAGSPDQLFGGLAIFHRF